MADPYAAWVHLPPPDLSDLDPRFERARDEELAFYDDGVERAVVVERPGSPGGLLAHRGSDLGRSLNTDLGYSALVGPGVKT